MCLFGMAPTLGAPLEESELKGGLTNYSSGFYRKNSSISSSESIVGDGARAIPNRSHVTCGFGLGGFSDVHTFWELYLKH